MRLEDLYKIIKKRKKSKDKNSYVAKIFKVGKDAIIQKIGEEATEVIIASKNSSKKEIVYETADLFFMILLLLNLENISLKSVFEELERRNNYSSSESSNLSKRSL